MARSKSTPTRSSVESQSAQRKPHPDFPLTWNKASRYWCKKIRGKVHRFGARDCDAQTALDEYLRVKDDLLAGRKPRQSTDGVTVRYACNHFLTDRSYQLESGELTQRSFDDYKKAAERLVTEFGANRLLEDLGPDDFSALRAKLAKGWAPTTLANEIQRIRVILNHAWKAAIIDKPIRTGPSFKRPPKRIMRQHRQAKGRKLFAADEIRGMVDAASPELRAMILLGINCGLGNRDCAKLEFQHLDLTTGWLDYPRPKTAVKRRAKLWPETVDAIQAVIAHRKPPKDEAFAQFVFITKYRGPWYSDKGVDCPISKETRKVLDGLGFKRKGVSFYALRHTFKTIADETRDFPAVEQVMGHEAPGIEAVYREHIGDDRLEAVADHVRSWLFTSEDGSDE